MPSTVISSYKYDPENQILQIRFVSGILYNYKDVPEELYEAMKKAFSKGVFFNEHIKDKYEFEKVK